MSARPPLQDDEALAAQLRRRAHRGDLSPDQRMSIIGIIHARTDPRRRIGQGRVSLMPATGAAGLALLAVAALIGVFATAPPRPGPTDPSIGVPTSDAVPAPNEAPPPDADPPILTQAELVAMIAAARDNGDTRYVMAQARIERTMRMPAGNCTQDELCLIGFIPNGASGGPVVSAGIDVRATLEPSAEPVTGELAFRISDDVVELLGAVDRDNGRLMWGVEAVVAATETTPLAHVVALDGWLVGFGPMHSCEPQRPPSPRPNTPFVGCPDSSWITPEEFQPVDAVTGGYTTRYPDLGVRLQPAAYFDFALDPARVVDGTDVPRRGRYLVRSLEDPRRDCEICRGWQLVGRLDPGDPVAEPSPPPSPEPSASSEPEALRVLTTDELVDLLIDMSSSASKRIVIVDAFIDREVTTFGSPLCLPDDRACARWFLGGTARFVWATDSIVERFGEGRTPILGPLAFLVGGDSYLELLGQVAPADGGSLVWTVDQALDPVQRPELGSLIVAEGWLVGTPFEPSCPEPEPFPPDDSPFVRCPISSWLTEQAYQPVTVSASGHPVMIGISEDGIRLQRTAYDRFAEDPAVDEWGRNVPREGVYLLERVEWPRPECQLDDCTAWAMTSRIDSAAGAGPSPVADVSVGRAYAAVPDSNLDPAVAASLAQWARERIVESSGLGPRPFAAARVTGTPRAATIVLHLYDTAQVYVVELELEDGEPLAATSTTVHAAPVIELSRWEMHEAIRIAASAFDAGTDDVTTGEPMPTPCPVNAGFCVMVPFEDRTESPSHVADAIVDIGREIVVEMLPRPAPGPGSDVPTPVPDPEPTPTSVATDDPPGFVPYPGDPMDRRRWERGPK